MTDNQPIPDDAEGTDETYPCELCGKLRTKAGGGTTFTVCDECWTSHGPYDVHKACNSPRCRIDAIIDKAEKDNS